MSSIVKRMGVAVLVAMAAFMALLAAPASAQGAVSGAPSAYNLQFKYSLSQFLGVRKQHPGPYNWSTDKCSVPKWIKYKGISGKAIVDHFFTDQCIRHDFGYRNNRAFPVGPGKAFADRGALKDAIDKQLSKDMNQRCDRYSHFNPQRPICYGASKVVYQAVHRFSHFK